jgi:hypothetical protein
MDSHLHSLTHMRDRHYKQVRSQTLTAEIASASTTHAVISEQVAAMVRAAATATARVAHLTEMHAAVSGSLTDVQQQYAFSSDCAERLVVQLDEQMMAYEARLQAAAQIRAELEIKLHQQQESLMVEINRTQAKEATAAALLASKESDLCLRQQQLTALQELLMHHQTDHVLATSARAQLESQCSDLQQQLHACEQERTSILTRRETLNHTVGHLQQQLSATHAESARELANLKAQCARAVAHAKQQGHEKAEQFQEAANATTELLCLQLQSLRVLCAEAQTELEAQISELYRSIAQHQHEKDDLCAQLQQTNAALHTARMALVALDASQADANAESQRQHEDMRTQLLHTQHRHEQEVEALHRKLEINHMVAVERQASSMDQLLQHNFARRQLLDRYVLSHSHTLSLSQSLSPSPLPLFFSSIRFHLL